MIWKMYSTSLDSYYVCTFFFYVAMMSLRWVVLKPWVRVIVIKTQTTTSASNKELHFVREKTCITLVPNPFCKPLQECI